MDEYKVERFQQDVENIDNSAFVKAIENMRENFTDENKQDVINKAVFDVTYFVPAFFDSTSELAQGEDLRLSFAERPTSRFVLVENPEGEKYIPAFTDHNMLIEFRKAQAEGCQAFVMSFADIGSIVETFPDIAGFVINPFAHNLPFTKDYILDIKRNIVAQLEKLKEQQGGPDITMTTNEQ